MDAIGDLKWGIFILAVIFFFWLITGGPERLEVRKGPFIKPLAPVGSGEIYGPDVLNRNTEGETTN